MRNSILFVLAAALLVVGSAGAQSSAADAGLGMQEQMPPLSQGLVKRAVAAMEELKTAGLVDNEESPSDGSASDNAKKMNAIAKRHGFRDMYEFTAAANSVMRAYGALRLREEVGDDKEADAKYEKARQQVQANDKLTDEQKQYELKMLEMQHQVYTQLSGNDEAELVRPYRKRIEKVLQTGD